MYCSYFFIQKSLKPEVTFILNMKILCVILILNSLVSGLISGRSRNAIFHSMGKFQRYMFSGIVEEIGTVKSIFPKKDMISWNGSVVEGVELSVIAEKVLSDAYIGCSVSVNGVCLTATSVSQGEVRQRYLIKVFI